MQRKLVKRWGAINLRLRDMQLSFCRTYGETLHMASRGEPCIRKRHHQDTLKKYRTTTGKCDTIQREGREYSSAPTGSDCFHTNYASQSPHYLGIT